MTDPIPADPIPNDPIPNGVIPADPIPNGVIPSDAIPSDVVDAVAALFAALRATAEDPGPLLDPVTAAPDVLRWIAHVVGADANLPTGLLRGQVAHAMTAHRRRGTVAGLHALVALYGGTAEVTEEGRAVTVEVTLPEADLADVVHDAVTAAIPAHVRPTVRVRVRPNE
ncbi:phage tail protein [Actinokineospora diospyrosa]|uniref:Phage tail protein (Tail_P2_I) n=1 Tax=Actinokineospora diospyrosa TaxID=103728 RepID=A0ABT1I8T0_9PSEU|nr:phage tail protein [Actinokineospora diospyrosa]MCP2268983.1 Phage tail protein (Tail_P2_I) [Actinokineospora diospyrosa]